MNPIYQTFIQAINDFLDKESSAKVLWVLDEHALTLKKSQINAPEQITFVTNRIDQLDHLTEAGFQCLYSDFDFTALDNDQFDLLVYRVSKEKAVVHHVINQAAQVLKDQAPFILAGGKNEGIKTYSDKAIRYFNCAKSIEKLTKDIWISHLVNNHQDQPMLDDKKYTEQIEINDEAHTYISKPGVFGWNKIDQGSAFLLKQMPEFIKRLNISEEHTTNAVLDLGCGYGFLLTNIAQYGFTKLVGTDNNAAAIHSAKETLKANHLDGEIIAANCAETIEQKFDVILCNPPFHQGFSVEGELTDRFLAATRRLLTSGGAAIFVVNTFIPLEAKAKNYFKKIDLLDNDKSFKVLRLSGKKPFHKD